MGGSIRMNSVATENLAAAADRSPIELEVARIRELTKRGSHGEALTSAEALLAQVPENRDALYLMALNQRHLRRTTDALATLDRLEQLHPGFSRLYQERGHCYVALRDSAHAIESFLRGVNINPALPASWSMLEGLYRLTGDASNAKTAAQHVATLKKLPPEVVVATGLFSDGEWAAAEGMIRGYLIRHGDHVEAMRLLARIGIFRGVFDDAELLLEGVLALAPEYQAARQEYALVLVERHKYAQARSELDRLLKLDPANPQLRTLYATACVGLGEQAKPFRSTARC
jgi:predicted Zn-dependent protease